MSDTYVECLVKGHSSAAAKILKWVLIVLTVIFVFLMFIPQISIIGLLLAVISGVGTYFVGLYTDIEYEYLYLDKEISVDQILGKSKRKKIGEYQIDRMEILASVSSYHLDDYKNRQVKVKDFSSADPSDERKCYAMYYEGGEKILLTPNEELTKAIRNVAPRKVFLD